MNSTKAYIIPIKIYFIAFILIFKLQGCYYRDYPMKIIEGSYFESINVPLLRTGYSSKIEVRKLLGEPYKITLEDNGSESWLYFMRRERSSKNMIAHHQDEYEDQIVLIFNRNILEKIKTKY
jgi:outer membrane protein assembly factor BamE (lipoprotein component of BamABCDE complex)